MTDKIVVLCTCASSEQAASIGRALVDARLAACASILPALRSIYRWKGTVETADEALLIVKSSREKFSGLRAEIEKLHSYQVPEIVALPIVEGARNYMNWLEGELAG